MHMHMHAVMQLSALAVMHAVSEVSGRMPAGLELQVGHAAGEICKCTHDTRAAERGALLQKGRKGGRERVYLGSQRLQAGLSVVHISHLLLLIGQLTLEALENSLCMNRALNSMWSHTLKAEARRNACIAF